MLALRPATDAIMRKKYVDKGRGAPGKPSVLDAAPEPTFHPYFGERSCLAVWAASSDDDHIVGGYCLTAASPQYSNHPWSARFLSSVKGG